MTVATANKPPVPAKASPNNNKPATSTSTTSTSANSSMAILGTIFHLLFAFFCVYLTPFGRSTSSFTSQLYDLLFTDKLEAYEQVQAGSSYIGPAMLATITRPLGLLFDERVRLFVFDKIVPKFPQIPAAAVLAARQVFIETKMWNLVAARLILATAFVLSLAVLRSAMAKKFKSAALPRIFSALCFASAIPSLAASALSTQTISMILLNFALAALFDGKLARSLSLLTVNLVIFDSVGGSILLLSFLLASSSIKESFSLGKAFGSVALTLPVALTVTFAFDSLFYNKFTWPQGEILLSAFKSVQIPTVEGVLSLAKTFEFDIKTFASSKTFVNVVISLAPALAVYLLGRSNRYTRALLTLYTAAISFNLFLLKGTLNSACTPLIIPLLTAASISVLGGTRSSNKLAKSTTYLFFLGVILPGIFWTVGRLHLEIATAQQFTGKALMALNAKIIKESQEGVPVRVHLDSEITGFGYNRFMELSRQAIYSSGPQKPARTDYFIGNCPESSAKALKMFPGFQKVDIKSAKILTSDRIGVYRASETCPINQVTEAKQSKSSYDTPDQIPSFIANKFFNGKFSTLKEQRDFISQSIGKFNHKKVSNSVALVAYLYANILEQI